MAAKDVASSKHTPEHWEHPSQVFDHVHFTAQFLECERHQFLHTPAGAVTTASGALVVAAGIRHVRETNKERHKQS